MLGRIFKKGSVDIGVVEGMYIKGAVEGAANTESGSRVFVYEVVGLRQSEETDKTHYPIRKSGSVFITVPYNRMNQEMRRIIRLGGKIVSIQLLSALEQLNGKISTASVIREVETAHNQAMVKPHL